ncbi:MAG TPA: hypothetical protein PLC80_01480, partial [Draconibacterium sp.]|nr:hypothetical protein [Draconibacterium sp.]
MKSRVNIHYIILVIFFGFITACNNLPNESTESAKLPHIFPDYTDLTIPPNIAPLNFLIKEPGEKFAVRISSKVGEEIIISGKS